MTKVRASLRLVVSLVPVCFASMGQAQEAVLHVDCAAPLHAVDPHLFGIFFEEINHAGEGGLYGELMQNRAFEAPLAGTEIPGWSLRARPGAEARMAIDSARPCQAEAPAALRVDIGSGQAGVVGLGHFGVPLQAGSSYLLRFDARREEASTITLQIALESAGGKVLAAVDSDPLGSEWGRHELRLTPSATTAEARLLITASGTGTLWLDTVSLFPATTFRAQRYGLRSDLGRLLAGLSPAFVRFPGGCYVEGGDRLRDAFRWQETIGDIAGRPGHLNANWGYWSTCGLGYHEYLLLCEDLGAAPMFVVNCGMSHKELVPLEGLQPYVQSALDAIEYANGPSDSKWGARRAANGHREPFGLRYIEIGNENGNFGNFGGSRSQYTERYRVFYDAIKRKHPEIITIANTRVDAPMEIVDDHFYQSCAWFWQNSTLYDRADRKGPKIYVGEYAVTQDPGLGNLAAALAESAFMTGLLRNSDIVTMASYAPLLVHVADRKWNPDLIGFDGLSSYGTPSYWAQSMFAQNRPDTALSVRVPEFRDEAGSGSIGLGTWNTRAEYREVRVEIAGTTVYASDFAKGTEGWQFVAGDWKVEDGALRQGADGDNQWCWLRSPALSGATDYVLRCRARKLAGAEGFLLMFHVASERDWTWFNVGGWGDREHAIERSSAGGKSSLGAHVRGSVETGRWYDLRVECEAGHIRTFLDDKLVHDVVDMGIRNFAATAGRAANGDLVLFAVNGSDSARRVTLQLAGAGDLASTAEGTELTSASRLDENSLAEPTKVAPRPVHVAGVAASFVHQFSPRSLTVLRLGPQR